MDETLFYKMTYGLYIVSSAYEGKESGLIMNTLTQVTAKPVQFTAALHKDSCTARIIRQSKTFAATILTQEIDRKVISYFGFKSGDTINKFEDFPVERDKYGNPYIPCFAAARYSFKVEGEVDLGTHILFIAKATEAEKLSDGELLTYRYYREVNNGRTPKNAPSYVGV